MILRPSRQCSTNIDRRFSPAMHDVHHAWLFLYTTTLAAAAAAGVDVISVGALTYSVKALDISMDIGRIK
ncbi:hypothetical protein [uncultured Mitsuokella sp.]|uniref:hypothetical protein n=1 Tax=uncultured Mitsuokella sp. TaxID=453120 RepID=UPI00349FFD58